MIDYRRWFIAATALALSIGMADAQTQYLISTYAGGLPGPTSAVATSYAIQNSTAVATDRFGNVYVGTAASCVFRLDPNGYLSRVAGTCEAGYSGDGGNALVAQLNNPQGLAVDSQGNLYIADQNNERIRQVTPGGIITTVAGTGTAGFSGDHGPATSAQLSTPAGIAIDPAGNLYIADQGNQVIRKVAATGVITTIGGTRNPGSTGDGGPATSAALDAPNSLALDAAGDLYIGDGSYQVRKITPGGIILHVAGTGVRGYSGDSGPASSAQLGYPAGLAVAASGDLYIADKSNRVIREVNPSGIITTFAGGGSNGTGDNGPAIGAELSGPTGVAVDYNNNVFIADQSSRVRKVNAGGTITTVVGTGALPFSGDGGPAGLAQFSGIWGLTFDGAGNLYVADRENNRVRKITPAGIVSTFAGTGSSIDSGDGGQAVNAGVTPYTLAADSLGNVYLADNAVVRKIAIDGTISTVAGTGTNGSTCANGSALSVTLSSYLTGLAVDSNQNLYISDSANNCIRKVVGGTITTVAGTGAAGYSGDGAQGTAAQLNQPAGLAVDPMGNLYIADYNNFVVRKLAINGAISTVAGNGGYGATGDGLPATSARMTNPWGVALDASGNLYIATQGNTIRAVSSSGIINTIAGTGLPGFSGDGGPATAALLNDPLSVAAGSSGNIYVSDFGNNAVRILEPAGTEPLLAVASQHTGIFNAGQMADFILIVSNAPLTASASGTVTVTETLPASLSLVSMSGIGWNCSSNSCTTSNSLAAGSTYQPITVAVTVASGAPPQVTNLVTVSGGGSPAFSSDDVAAIGPPVPVLEIAATHSGNFVLGTQETYTVTVANQAAAASTGGTVTVSDTVPNGLALISMAGTGWACTSSTCTRSDPLSGGASYNPITVTVSVMPNAPGTVTNQATVSGGGSQSASATDSTTIIALPCSVTGDIPVGIADVQTVINQALGAIPAASDLNQDGMVNIADIQIVINAALSLGCTL